MSYGFAFAGTRFSAASVPMAIAPKSIIRGKTMSLADGYA